MRSFFLASMIALIALVSVPELIIPSVAFGTFASSNVSKSYETANKGITVVFLGDLFLGRRVETMMAAYGEDYPYRRMMLPTEASAVVANFESSMPIKHIHTPDLTFRFSVDPRYIPTLKNFGVTHLGVANNHTYDAGEIGYQETIKGLEEAGFSVVREKASDEKGYSVIETENDKVAIFAINAVDRPLDEESLRRMMINSSSTYQVAFIHWGVEYESFHGREVSAMARQLVDIGFDAIVGHHPHVVQDIEIIDGVPVFYSLGNFIFDQYFSNAVQEGLMLTMNLSNEKAEFNLIPFTSADVRTQPRLMNTDESSIFLRNLAEKSPENISEMVKNGKIVLLR